MKVKIKNRIYDTEKSKEIGRRTVHTFGDPKGYEVIIFQKKNNQFFLLGRGGEESIYPTETIIPLDLEDAEKFLVDILGEEKTKEILAETVCANEKTESEDQSLTKETKQKKRTTAKKSTK